MRAAIYSTYGPPEVIGIKDVEQPSIKEQDRVLIRVHSASVNTLDHLYRKGYLPTRMDNGLTKPKNHILGIDVAGTIEAVGDDVRKFKVGDHVFGSCFGSHAEYVAPRENFLSHMPKNITFEEAAAIPCAAQTALQALRDVAQVKQGQRVLIYGASGGVGHFAVQLANYFGAEVTAVCSTSNLDWVKELGAQYVIDYTKEDFTDNGNKYDIIIMDPPCYGRGANGEVWSIEKNLYDLIDLCAELLSDTPIMFAINTYTGGLSGTIISNVLTMILDNKRKDMLKNAKVTTDEIGIIMKDSDFVLPCGITTKWEK